MMPDMYDRLKQNYVVVALFVALGLYLLWLAWPVWVVVFVALILTVALLPLVNFLHRGWMPRAGAVLIVFVGLAGLLTLIGYFLFPPLVDQLQRLLQRLPQIITHLPFVSGVQIEESLLDFLRNQISNLQQIALTVTTTLLAIVVAVISIIVISIYWLVDYQNIREGILKQFGKRRADAERAFNNVERRLGGWVRGQILLSVSVGVLSLIAYLIIGLPAAIPLAVLAGILEIIPVLGPTLAAIPALLIAFSVSPITLLYTLIAYLIIQQIEGNYLAPKIMSRAAHLHPLTVIIVVLIGGELAGLIGVLLAVPVALFILAIQQRWQAGSSQRKNTLKT